MPGNTVDERLSGRKYVPDHLAEAYKLGLVIINKPGYEPVLHELWVNSLYALSLAYENPHQNQGDRVL